MNFSLLCDFFSFSKFRTKKGACSCVKKRVKVVVPGCLFLLHTALLRRRPPEGAEAVGNQSTSQTQLTTPLGSCASAGSGAGIPSVG